MKPYLKYGIFAIAFVAVAAVATPKLLSTEYVKQRIADQLSSITGRSVVLNGGSTVSLRPYLSVSYNDVIITDPEDDDPEPLLHIDSLRAELSILSAIWGDARLSELHLVRPQFNLRVDHAGRANWIVDKGPLAARLATPANERPASLRLGSITMESGIIHYEDAARQLDETLTDVNGTLTWPGISAAATVRGSSVWRGEVVDVSLQSQSPFELLRGGASTIDLSIASKPLELKFQGKLEAGEKLATGDILLVTPSAMRLAEWWKKPLPASALLGRVSVDGEVSANLQNAEFPKVALSIGEHTGVGRLQVSVPRGMPPTLSGTLAFDTIAAPDLAFDAPQDSATSPPAQTIGLNSISGYRLDLRLSANTARWRNYTLTGIAAAANVRDGSAVLDIGQAEMLGGMLTGSFSLSGQSSVNQTANGSAPDPRLKIGINAALSNLDLDKLATLGITNHYTLAGEGDLSVNLKSVHQPRENPMRKLNGSLRLSASQGVLQGIDLAAVMETGKEEEDRVWQAPGGETSFERLLVDVAVANGIAIFTDSRLESPNLTVKLSGRSDLIERSLALRGFIEPPAAGQQDTPPALPFYVGGTSAAPLFVPLFTRRQTGEAQAAQPLKKPDEPTADAAKTQ